MPKLLVVSPVDLGPELGRSVLWRPSVERFVAADGPAAMELARRTGPSLIVVDGFDPPGATDLIRRLRADSHTRPTAIAVLSRSPSLADEASFRRAGANVVFAGVVHPELWDARLEELLNVPRRLEARIPVRLATWSRATPEAPPLEGLTMNISINGILLQTPARLGVGTKIDLSFTLPERKDEVQVLGQIMRETAGGPERWLSGVKFLILRGDARERIAGFIEASVRIAGEPAVPAVEAEPPEPAQWQRDPQNGLEQQGRGPAAEGLAVG